MLYATPGACCVRSNPIQSSPYATMKIVAANHADSLRRPGSWDTDAIAVLDTVREELRGFYGDAHDDLPVELTTLAQRLDSIEPGQGRAA